MSTRSATGAPVDEESRRADVELRVPADNAYASVLRTTTAGLAARLDFPIDDIEDLRIAVGEASAMVLPQSVPGTDLHSEFFLAPGAMTIRVGVTVDHDITPDYDSFAWQVLTTLATSAAAECVESTFTITLTMESTLPGAGL